jgi:RNA polymerase sigma-70 factor (ECF subfamily)
LAGTSDRLSDSGVKPEISDLDLVKACLAGKHQHFRGLYHRHQAKVRSTLCQLCGPEHLDDLVQEVFLRAWKSLGKFRQTAQFSTWIYRITWNVACDRRRSLVKRRDRWQQLTQVAKADHSHSVAAPDLIQVHYQDLVQRGLNQLRWEHRAVLVLHDLEEKKQKEVAEILSIPVGTVKSRLFHARSSLRKFLQQEGLHL